jgi:hypothetical protein
MHYAKQMLNYSHSTNLLLSVTKNYQCSSGPFAEWEGLVRAEAGNSSFGSDGIASKVLGEYNMIEPSPDPNESTERCELHDGLERLIDTDAVKPRVSESSSLRYSGPCCFRGRCLVFPARLPGLVDLYDSYSVDGGCGRV